MTFTFRPVPPSAALELPDGPNPSGQGGRFVMPFFTSSLPGAFSRRTYPHVLSFRPRVRHSLRGSRLARPGASVENFSDERK